MLGSLTNRVAIPFGPTAWLRLKILCDETVCALRRSFTFDLAADAWARIGHEGRAAVDLFTSAGWISDPTSYHDAPDTVGKPVRRRITASGFRFEELCFPSEYQPHAGEPGAERWMAYEANTNAYAWILRHEGPPRPWLVCIPGYSMGMPFFDLRAFQASWLHERLGLNVAIAVLPLHGPRRLGWVSGEGFFAGDCMDTIHASAQALWDIRRLIGWLRAGEGAPQIGVYGISLGGYLAALTACFEADLACVIAGIPATDFVDLARRHYPPRLLSAVKRNLGWGVIEKLFDVVSPLRMPTLVPRDRRYIFGGLHDRIVPPAQVRALQSHWECPRVTWYRGSHFSCTWEPRVRSLLRRTLRTALCASIDAPGCRGRQRATVLDEVRARAAAHAGGLTASDLTLIHGED